MCFTFINSIWFQCSENDSLTRTFEPQVADQVSRSLSTHIKGRARQSSVFVCYKKVSFVSRSTKDLQKMPLRKLSFLYTLFLENEDQTSEKKYRAMFVDKNEAHMQELR